MGFSTFPNNPFPPSTAQFDEGKNDAIQAEIDAIKDGTSIDSFADAESALATKTNLSNIAPAFDATSGVYGVGDKIIYEGVLYEFTSAHSTAGEWDESEVQPVKVSELIDSLKSGLTNKTPYLDLPLTGGLSDLDDQLNANFSNIPLGVSCGRVGNQAGVYSALAVRYSDTYATVSMFDVSNGDNLIWHKDTQGHSIYNVSDILTSAQLYRDLVSIPVGSTVVETSRNGDYELMSAIQINSNTSVCGNIKAYFSSGKWYIQSDASVTTNDASICCVFRHV